AGPRRRPSHCRARRPVRAPDRPSFLLSVAVAAVPPRCTQEYGEFCPGDRSNLPPSVVTSHAGYEASTQVASWAPAHGARRVLRARDPGPAAPRAPDLPATPSGLDAGPPAPAGRARPPPGRRGAHVGRVHHAVLRLGRVGGGPTARPRPGRPAGRDRRHPRAVPGAGVRRPAGPDGPAR